VRYRLPIILQKNTLLDLQREARNRRVPIEVLIVEMIEDYLEGRGETGSLPGTQQNDCSANNIHPLQWHP
jgi:hypothetical protein